MRETRRKSCGAGPKTKLTLLLQAWLRFAQIKASAATKAVAVLALVIAVGTILSTLFIKQHYIADEIAGISLALIVGKVLFDKLWKSEP